MEEITCEGIVKVLKKLPEKKFRIMELAPQLIDEKGKVDIVKAIDKQPELNTAIVEVQAYIKEVKELYRVLLYLSLGKKETWVGEDEDIEVAEDEDIEVAEDEE